MAQKGQHREIGGYYAQRGWFYASVQEVVRAWTRVIGKDTIVETFDSINRVIENGTGIICVETHGADHRKCLCELITALDELHNAENPAGWVVKLCGLAKRPTLLSVSELKNLRSLTYKLRHPSDPVSEFLNQRFSKKTKLLLQNLSIAPETLRSSLVGELNQLLKGDSIYDNQRFAKVALRFETRRLSQLSLRGLTRISLNRLLLEDAYPSEITKSDYVYMQTAGTRFLFSYAEMAKEIIARGGPEFTEDVLRKAAQRLRLTGSHEEHEQSVHQR